MVIYITIRDVKCLEDRIFFAETICLYQISKL